MFKRILGAALAAAMCISLAACGGSSTTTSSAPAASEPAAPASSGAAAPASSAASTDASTPAASGETIRVGVSLLNKQHVFYNNIEAAMVAKAPELNVELIVQDASGDANKQLSQVQDFITQAVDAIVICPTNSAGSKSMVELATAANIPVFTMDIASDGETVAHIATDNYKGGELAAEYMVNNMLTDKKGNVGVITYSEIESCVQREKGFTDWIAANAPDVVVADIQNYSGDQSKAADVMANMLLKTPDLAAVFCVGDPAATGAMASITSANSQCKVIGFDGNPEGIDAIKSGGLWVADVAQDPTAIGETTLQTVVDYLGGAQVESNIPIAPYIIDASNAE